MDSEAKCASERQKKKKARKQVNTQENKDTKEASLKAILILYAKEH